jgi:hypothetical protein
MTELPDYGSPFMMTRRIAGGLRRKAAEYRKGDKPQSAEGCDEDADALEALLLAYQERGRALEALMDADHAALDAGGFLSCCPERDMKPPYADHIGDATNMVASPVVPVGVSRGDMRRATLEAIRHLDSEDPNDGGLAALVAGKNALFSCSEDPSLQDARGCFHAMIDALIAASPVVPASEGEVVAWFRNSRSKADRWFQVDASEIEDFRGMGYTIMPLYASPVVPVGVSRETLLKAVRPVLDRHPMIDSSQSHKLDIQAGWVADAILAALRPTDTGWRDIAGAPLGVRVLADVVFNPPHTYFGARRVEIGSFDGHGWCGEGVGGEPVAWMPAPLPPAPTDTGRE